MKPKKLATAILSFALLSGAAQADIATDLQNGLEATVVIENALTEGLTLEAIMLEIAAIDPALVPEFVGAAIAAGQDASAVIAAARATNTNPSPEQQAEFVASLEQAAILAGADPTVVAEATAAGGPGQGNPQGQGQGLAIAPGQTGIPVIPSPFGNNAGGGGGGNPSST